jgi:hypothetical protein
MLPFAFLAAGAAAGRAVCRLVVPVFAGASELVDITDTRDKLVTYVKAGLIAPSLGATLPHLPAADVAPNPGDDEKDRG